MGPIQPRAHSCRAERETKDSQSASVRCFVTLLFFKKCTGKETLLKIIPGQHFLFVSLFLFVNPMKVRWSCSINNYDFSVSPPPTDRSLFQVCREYNSSTVLRPEKVDKKTANNSPPLFFNFPIFLPLILYRTQGNRACPS